MDVQSTIRWATPLPAGLLLGLAALALAAFVLLRRISGRPIAPARRPGLLALRVLILAVVVVILINPVRVDRTPGSVERPRVLYLLDTSESMALGKGTTRWDQVIRTIREAEQVRNTATGAEVGVFRFGSRLAAVESPFWDSDGPNPPPGKTEPPPTPTDFDTRLSGALEELAGRFGQAPPAALFVFSDGRARDAAGAELLARGFGRMELPIHVVPVGDAGVGGDVALVSLVAPAQVRKSSRVAVQVLVRSFGLAGRRAELTLAEVGADGRSGPVLARTPIALADGLASHTLAFDSGDHDRRIEARVGVQPGEVSAQNNAFAADLAIDHTKIRVLYLEGSTRRFIMQRAQAAPLGGQLRGDYSPLQEALMEDPDIECTVALPAGYGDFSVLRRIDEAGRGLPETPSELFAYDAIILSDVPREALSDQHLEWVERWIGRRGGGLGMVGGPNSFASGRWGETVVGAMLPVELLPTGPDWAEGPAPIRTADEAAQHPIWHIVSDEGQNRTLLRALPTFVGANRVGRVKPGADVLARTEAALPDAEPMAAIAAQPYGQGRTLAMVAAITDRYAGDFTKTWGVGDNRYYKKFWRNVIYWLTENSSIGRRRLLAEADKALYRPGEPLVLRARTFDENAAPTLDYRVAATVEPKSATTELSSDNSPLRRPGGEAGQGPLIPWGEEFDLDRQAAETSYAVTLPIADARSLPPDSRELRIELTAYENNTQVDSTALDVQILDDPPERQNPLPDHDLLRRLAAGSGGRVLRDARDLAAVLDRLPVTVGPPEIKRVPAWSRGWLLALLLGLITLEWVWRRRLGLA